MNLLELARKALASAPAPSPTAGKDASAQPATCDQSDQSDQRGDSSTLDANLALALDLLGQAKAIQPALALFDWFAEAATHAHADGDLVTLEQVVSSARRMLVDLQKQS
jgi:hypothetical protein